MLVTLYLTLSVHRLVRRSVRQPVGRSVGPSVRRSVGRSVGQSVHPSVGHTFVGGVLSSNASETAWTFPTPFYRMNIYSPRMVYVYFHRPIYHRDFSMTVLLKIINGQDTYSVMYLGVCLISCLLCHAPGGRPRHVMRGP